jgi:hypothetical protein
MTEAEHEFRHELQRFASGVAVYQARGILVEPCAGSKPGIDRANSRGSGVVPAACS